MNYNGLRNVHPEAKIGKDVVIENFVSIGKDVVIGDGAWIGPHVTIMDGVRIGNNCKIFPGAVVGAIPQDLKFEGESSVLEIGNNVTIREYCTLNRGTKASDHTVIHDNCLLMAYVHVAHDCVVGRNSILANNVNLAGHITVGEFVVLGGLVAVHQFVKIGDHAMVGGGSLVRKDIPPYVKAARDPLSYVGINSTGLKRRGFSVEQVNHIQDIYRILFVKGFNTTQALREIEDQIQSTTERNKILDFVKISSQNRGLMKGFRHLNGSRINGQTID
ncbi:MAG TPA: acyl-ACP--UDP-N-acetylglucosamine O-acyltransferase [Saprospiraceae bacterium]|nr:acyl-ACP--UDP-N-acetylglucosamine O-acyltransferase [Saprospiraceae bacterium]